MGARPVAPPQHAADLGRRLLEARQKMGWDLGAASAATAIPAQYLDALEKGRLDLLPGPVYARGYVRTYATALHLDSDRITYAFTRLQPQGRFDAVTARLPSRRQARPVPSRRWTKVLKVVLAGFLGLLVVNAVWAAVGPSGVDDTSLDRRPPSSEPRPEPASPAPTAPPAPVGPLAPVSSDSEGAAYAVGRQSYTVTVEATGRAWVQVRQGPDGDVVYEGTLSPGQTHVVPANGPLWMRVGDQRNVRVLVEGAPVVLPGNSGLPYNLDLRP